MNRTFFSKVFLSMMLFPFIGNSENNHPSSYLDQNSNSSHRNIERAALPPTIQMPQPIFGTVLKNGMNPSFRMSVNFSDGTSGLCMATQVANHGGTWALITTERCFEHGETRSITIAGIGKSLKPIEWKRKVNGTDLTLIFFDTDAAEANLKLPLCPIDKGNLKLSEPIVLGSRWYGAMLGFVSQRVINGLIGIKLKESIGSGDNGAGLVSLDSIGGCRISGVLTANKNRPHILCSSRPCVPQLEQALTESFKKHSILR